MFTGAFDDAEVVHVDGEVNPVRDFDIISEELRLKDEETLTKALEKMDRTVVRANDKKMKPEYVSFSYKIMHMTREKKIKLVSFHYRILY